MNGDGRDEILVRTPALSVTLNPARGGTLTEIGALARRHDLADVLARRPEAYHARSAGAPGRGPIDRRRAAGEGAGPAASARPTIDSDAPRCSTACSTPTATLDPVEPWRLEPTGAR